MRDELPTWLGEPSDSAEDPRPRRLSLLLAMAAVPWVVMVVLLLGRGGDDVAAGHPHDSRAVLAAPTPAPEVGPPTPETPAPTALPALPQAGSHVEVRPGDVAAVVLAVARSWLTGVGPDLGIEGISAAERTYLEHLLIEGVEWVGDDLVVVTVLAAVLTPEEDHYRDVHLRRLAVPVRVAAGAISAAGRPWRLPGPGTVTVEEPVTVAVDDPFLLQEAAAALQAAGFHAPVATLALSASGPWIATLEADADPAPQVWLVESAAGLRVAGTTGAESMPTESEEVTP